MTTELPADASILAAATLLALGVLGAGLAAQTRLPAMLLFLGLGMLLGDDGLDLLSLDDPMLTQAAATVALLLILFEGGLTTKPGDLRRAAGPGLLLATLGVVVTAVVVTGGALVLLDIRTSTALLLGAVVASTDAAAVFSVLRRTPLPRRLTALLEVESGANDPVAIMLTVGILAGLEAPLGPVEVATMVLLQLGGGLVVGLVAGRVGSVVLSSVRLASEGLYPVLALAVGGLSYGLAALVGASGFLAVYVCGLLVGAHVPRHRRVIRTFHDGLANTAEIALFLLLGVLVFPSQLPAVALPALALAAVLVLVARPAAVAVCLPWFGYRLREMTLVSWAGLRGAVPIVLATFPLVAGHPEGNAIFHAVFFVVLVSVAVQALGVGPLADRLGLVDDAYVTSPVAEALPLEGVDADLIEVDVHAGLYIAGRVVRDVPLPAGALLTAVVRGQRALLPSGSTRMEPGDRLVIAAPRQPRATQDVVAWARGEYTARQARDSGSPQGPGERPSHEQPLA